MFGFGKKAKKPDGIDILIIKTDEAKNRNFYQVAFPSMVANDIVSMLKKLEKSKLNKPELLGEIGGFRIVTHLEALTSFDVLDDADMEAQPVQIQDFANILLRRLEALEESGKLGDSEDVAFIMGELTMLRDGSFVPQN
jgi:selenocysteine lyase/cysteine desulfurase